MNKQEIEQRFDEMFGIEEFIGDDFEETQFVLNNCRTTEEALSFFFDKILPEVLREILPEKRTWCDWSDDYNIAIEDIEQKAKEKYNITL